MSVTVLPLANQVIRQFADFPDVDMKFASKTAFETAIAGVARIPDGWLAYCTAEKKWFFADKTEGTAVELGSGAGGADGKTILNGAVNPTTEGVDGDFYINTATSFLFGPKASGTWPTGVSLVGPAGADGATGPAGADGVPGADGADGSPGEAGATGPAGSDATVNATNVASTINGATAKTTPVDTDTFGLIDSAASNALKKVTWLNIKATLKTWIEGTTFTLITATKGLFGTTTTKNAHLVVGASTSTLANEHKDWGAAYTGSEAGAEWKETTGYRKFLKRNGATDEHLFMGANPALAGTGVAMPLLAADGSWSRGPALDEGFTLDADIISAITGATYTDNYATITPSSSKVFHQGDEYFDIATKFLYKAVADNAVKRI